MKKLLLFISLFPLLLAAQTKTILIPPSKDTVRVTYTATTTISHSIDYLPTGPGNKAPIASAGNDISVTLPVNTVTLSAIASSDADGTISSYQWSKVSGGTAILNQANTALNVSGLVQGTYTFRVTVTDNGGLTDIDDVNVVVLPAVSNPDPGSGSVKFQMNKTNPVSGFSLSSHQWCCDYSITAVNAPDGSGDKVLKYDLRSSDPIVSGSKRAEYELGVASGTDGTTKTYKIKYWFEKYSTDGGAESILQWHDVDRTTPPLSIQVQNGRLKVTQSFTSGNIHTDLGPLETGKWVTIELRVKWSNGNDGFLQVWKDGVQKVNKSNIRTNSKGGCYAKIGINKWSWAPGGGSSSQTQRIFYIGDFSVTQ